MKVFAPSNPKDRFEVYRFFNGLSEEAKDGLDKRTTRVPLVKTFLLEHVACRGEVKPKPPAIIFKNLGAKVKMVDERLMGLNFDVADKDSKRTTEMTTGFLEQYDERFFAYYTCERSADAKKRVAKWVQTPDLDFAWFSSPLLQGLWQEDVAERGDERYGKLIFRHESIFDMPEDFAEEDGDESAGADTEGRSEDAPDDEEGFNEDKLEFERRKARFEMGDRIGKIKKALSNLQEHYEPLHALYGLRIPSRMSRGSHDVFQGGQITNRTDSFEDHRNTVRYLYRVYKTVLESTEESAWRSMGKNDSLSVGLKGVPLIIKFSEPLSKATFDRWVDMALKKRNVFKLWGEPIRLGPTKIHVYGADRHLWQPINLEITATGVVAVLPQGTCGNTFHRLVTNIQHYVSPKIQAWVGSEPFEDVVRRRPLKTAGEEYEN